jgi:hypothetical protein
VELKASSIGLAKAALEALSGFDLFGARGSQRSVVHVVPDNVAQANITLTSLLPRESNTKETDAALLSVVGFPAFAVQDEELRERVRADLTGKLEGRYGLKRFLRDGHQTVLEDGRRLHYEAEELKRFEQLGVRLRDEICGLERFGHVAAALALKASQVNRAVALLVDFDGYRFLLHSPDLLQRTAKRSCTFLPCGVSTIWRPWNA